MTISVNLKRLRARQGHSLERLAKLSGVSRAMLSQIETGKSVPTISLLLKVADALNVPIANLLASATTRPVIVLPRARARIAISSNGRFTSRALFPQEGMRRAEFFELRIAGEHREQAQAHPPGTRENIIVVQGNVELVVGNEQPVTLPQGDAAIFQGDVPRTFHNLGATEAILHVVVLYSEPVAPTSAYFASGEQLLAATSGS